MNNEVINNIITRRSVRSFLDQQITNEELEAILKAGTYAASGRGLQSPIIIAIQNKEVIENLSRINAEILKRTGDPFFGAPTVVMVLAKLERNTRIEDGSLVLGNMMLAAHSLGIGSCWIHRAKETLSYPYVKNLLLEYGIDAQEYEGVGHLVLGYPKNKPSEASPRKENYIYRIE